MLLLSVGAEKEVNIHDMSKVLILGSSFIAKPVVSYLSQFQSIDITIASNELKQAEGITSKYARTKAVELSVHNASDLSQLVGKHHLVISLVPCRIHLPVARSCIENKVNMLTASYLSPEMKELHQQALDADITMFNEIGFDPGIDHMLSMQCFDEVHEKGGKVKSYVSWCTGLPTPEAADVPLKYKFSWSPAAVLLNTLNPAKCLLAGKTITVPEGGELMKHCQTVDMTSVIQGVEFEGVYNRDSTKYINFYKIPEVETLLRGTLRYKGYCATMRGLQTMGVITSKQHPKLQPTSPPITWQELAAELMGTSVSTLKDEIFKRIDGDSYVMGEIEAMGLLSSKQVPLMGSPAHSLAEHLLTILSYKDGERDMNILHNIIDIEWPNNKKEKRTITLVEYGEPYGLSAMAKSVGIPAGIAAKLILEGKIKHKGIVLPLTKDVYQPILEELNAYIKPPTIVSTFL